MKTTGSVQEKNGRFYFVLNLYDANGKRKIKWISTGLTVRGNKRKAEAMLHEVLLRYDETGELPTGRGGAYEKVDTRTAKPIPAPVRPVSKSEMLFLDYLNEWVQVHKVSIQPATFIYVTHDQTEAMTMGDRIVVMKDGIIQQVDTPQNLYDMPCNMFVAGFIGSPQMNFLDGTVTKNGDQYAIDLGGDTIPLPKEKTADGKLDSYVGKKVKMGIRPEDIDDEPEFMAKHPDCHLEAQVDVSEMMGAEIYLYLEYKGNKMTARVAPTSKARNGDTVRVAFDPHKVHVFDVETEQTILN